MGSPVNEFSNCRNESTDTEIDCEERLNEPRCELQEKATSLGSPVNEDLPQQKKLDWNKILRFLAMNIHAETWSMFFDCLYGNTKLPKTLNCRERTRRVELDVRSRYQGTEYLILEQLKSWKEAAGNNASIELIKESFEDLGQMDTLETFKTYMSNPPFLDDVDVSMEQNEETKQLNDSVHAVSIPSQTLYTLPPGSKWIKETHSRVSFEMSQTRAEQRYNLADDSLSFDMTNNSNVQILGSQPALSDPDQTHKPLALLKTCENNFPKKVETCQATRFSNSTRRLRKGRKKLCYVCNTNVKRRKPVRRRRKRASVPISLDSIAILIEQYVQMDHEIKPDMHDFATKNTIDELVKSGIRRDLVLCLTYKEYSEIINDTNKRGDVIYSLYIGDELYPLKSRVHKQLKLYVDHVRSKVIRRLTNSNEEDYTYIFIGYNGNPINKKREDMSEDTDTEGSETSQTAVYESSYD